MQSCRCPSTYLRVNALHSGALAAAAVVREALVDVVAVEAVPGPSDGAMSALEIEMSQISPSCSMFMFTVSTS